jgi:hypothetical protein
MAVKKINKTYESFYANDALVADATNPIYGVKVLKAVWVDAINDERLIVAYGKVTKGVWKNDTAYSGEVDTTLMSAESLRSQYAAKWTPDSFEAGDILKDQNGDTYIVASLDVVWRLGIGTYAPLSYWESNGKEFTQMETAGGGKFSKYLKVSSKL